MPDTTYVAVDIETTGLDPDRDAIIEVATILFRGEEILDEQVTLINPDQIVPPFISRLTGITQAMVDGAPSMFAVRSRLRTQIGDHVVVGHNVGFDMAFLNNERIGVGNHRLDTLTLASILFPEAGRYGLGSLIHFLGLPRPGDDGRHRALHDAHQTIRLFQALRERACQIDIDLLNEIVQSGRKISWPETLFFEETLAQRARTVFSGGGSRPSGRLRRLYQPGKLEGRIPVPADPPETLDRDMLAGLLRPGGNFSRTFPGFEHRSQQVEMLQAIVDAFNNGHHLLVEAGTGTGKSVGYLLPAAFWAHSNGRRVVISTNTINLQDQLINKDIPELQKILPFELRVAVRKGRRNYLCTRLFQQMRHSGPNNADEMALYARLLLWLPTTENADLAELNLRTLGERIAWARLSGDNAVCRMDDCAQEGCPLHMVRRRAELAHIVIVNHALLLSDVANNNHILPEFEDLIIDEAHHLETAVTDGLSFRADKRFLETILDEITQTRSGLIADLQVRLRDMPPAFTSLVEGYINKLREVGQQTTVRIDEFFNTLAYFLQDHVNRRHSFAEQIRLVPSLRTLPTFSEVEMSWGNLNKQLAAIVRGLSELAAGLEDLGDTIDLEDGEELCLALANSSRSLEESRTQLDQIIAAPVEGMIYWFEQYRDYISCHAAPLHIGPLVEKHIFDAKQTAILTSATMRTAGAGTRGQATFAYIRDRLHAHDAHELAVGSPFDYPNATLLYLCTDIPEPNQPGYQRYLEDAIVDVASSLGGRTMVLFTSYSHLNETARGIEQTLAEADIDLLAQRDGASRQQLLAQFKEPGARAVLLGTRSFWEGVDVPGPALQALLIARLPFDVPSDPVFAARSETFSSPFFEYSIPEAVLRFRQGFGRLIRRGSDEGVVAILDKRVLTKRYGSMFIEALPACTVLRQRTARLGELTLRWLNREK